MRRGHAFTLIEVVVATTLMLIIAAAAVGILSQAYATQAEGATRNQIARDAQLVVDTLSRDLAYAGVGVPRGFRNDTADFTGGTRESHQLRPIFRRFKSDHIAFVGDLPYPNADLNGLVNIVKMGSSNTTLFVNSELSGCVPPSSSPGDYECDTATASLVGRFIGDACEAGSLSRTCPWNQHKWQEGSRPTHIIIGGVDHSWYEREVDTDADNNRNYNDANTVEDDPFLGIELENTAPNGNNYAGGSAALPPARLFSARGGAFASQLDRVFWSLEDTALGSACSSTTSPFCVLRRRQCFGAVIDPGNSNFPSVGDSAFRSNITPTDCNPAQDDGTEWEVVTDGVRRIDFVAFDGAGNVLTGAWSPALAARVKTIGFTLELERRVPGTSRTVKHTATKRILIRNRGGIIGSANVADGACNTADDPGSCGGDEG
jgi:prepilin-type N-terminal cleavage/methylation domain-containing protein